MRHLNIGSGKIGSITINLRLFHLQVFLHVHILAAQRQSVQGWRNVRMQLLTAMNGAAQTKSELMRVWLFCWPFLKLQNNFLEKHFSKFQRTTGRLLNRMATKKKVCCLRNRSQISCVHVAFFRWCSLHAIKKSVSIGDKTYRLKSENEKREREKAEPTFSQQLKGSAKWKQVNGEKHRTRLKAKFANIAMMFYSICT